jgi:uncharacterized protein YegL
MIGVQMRRLPVFLLLDTSGSMRGEPIESVKVGVQALISSLRQDPNAIDCVAISIMTFDREVKVLCSLTPLQEFVLPDFTTPEAGPTHLGMALEKLCSEVDSQVLKTDANKKGDWRPLLFILTDGSPSDKAKYKEMIPEVRKRNFATIVGCAAGIKARKEDLEPLADRVVVLDNMDSSSFGQFFKWVSSSVSVSGTSMGITSSIELPPPPPEIHSIF